MQARKTTKKIELQKDFFIYFMKYIAVTNSSQPKLNSNYKVNPMKLIR